MVIKEGFSFRYIKIKIKNMRNLLAMIFVLFSFISQAQTTDTVTVHHDGYTTLWSSKLKYPLLVQWWDTKERCGCTQIPRKDQFGPDPNLKNQTDIQKGYDEVNKTEKSKNQKGFDRGHMSPAADNECPYTVKGKKFTAQEMLTQCFYFSNMAPQYHSLNAGDWKSLETRTRELTLQNDSVYVWCGSIGVQMVVGGLSIPTKCWKVIYIKKTKTYECYIFDNTTNKPQGLEHWKVTKEAVEKLTGFKFNI
jgi:endonuclease G